jgi:hypothetical protein
VANILDHLGAPLLDHLAAPIADSPGIVAVVEDINGVSLVDTIATVGQLQTLVLEDATSVGSVDTVGTVNQLQSLVLEDTTSVGAVDTVAVDQLHNLVLEDTTSVGAVDTVAVDQLHDLVLEDTTSVGAVDTVAVDQLHDLVLEDTTSVGEIETVSMSTVHELVLEDVTSVGDNETVVVVQLHDLTLDDATSVGDIDTVVYVLGSIDLIIDEPTSTGFIDSVVHVQDQTVTVSDATSVGEIDTVAQMQGANMLPEDATSVGEITTVAHTQHQILTVSSVASTGNVTNINFLAPNVGNFIQRNTTASDILSGALYVGKKPLNYRKVVVATYTESSNAWATTSVNFDGSPMVKIGEITSGTTPFRNRIELWFMDDSTANKLPTLSGNYDVEVVWENGDSIYQHDFFAWSITDAKPGMPIDFATAETIISSSVTVNHNSTGGNSLVLTGAAHGNTAAFTEPSLYNEGMDTGVEAQVAAGHNIETAAGAHALTWVNGAVPKRLAAFALSVETIPASIQTNAPEELSSTGAIDTVAHTQTQVFYADDPETVHTIDSVVMVHDQTLTPSDIEGVSDPDTPQITKEQILTGTAGITGSGSVDTVLATQIHGLTAPEDLESDPWIKVVWVNQNQTPVVEDATLIGSIEPISHTQRQILTIDPATGVGEVTSPASVTLRRDLTVDGLTSTGVVGTVNTVDGNALFCQDITTDPDIDGLVVLSNNPITLVLSDVDGSITSISTIVWGPTLGPIADLTGQPGIAPINVTQSLSRVGGGRAAILLSV